MKYAPFFENLSFYNELYTMWLGAIFSSPASSSLEACTPGFPVASSRRLLPNAPECSKKLATKRRMLGDECSNVPECSRMLGDECSRMLPNVPECSRMLPNVPECYGDETANAQRRMLECSEKLATKLRMLGDECSNAPECSRMLPNAPECSRMLPNARQDFMSPAVAAL